MSVPRDTMRRWAMIVTAGPVKRGVSAGRGRLFQPAVRRRKIYAALHKNTA